MTTSLFVQTTVKDFDSWKKLYDKNFQFRKKKGVLAESVHRNPDNPNSLMIYHQFANRDSLNEFFVLLDRSPEEFDAAGVLSFETWFGENV